jgi:AraC-like DNA-binding protein
MLLKKQPTNILSNFVEQFWLADMRGADSVVGARENVLPTGTMGIVFRLHGEPLKIFDGESEKRFSSSVIGGARAKFYTKDISQPAYSIGVVLKAESAGALFGFSAAELTGWHTNLEDVWGRESADVFEQMSEDISHDAKFEIFESLLVKKIRNAPHPVVADAVKKLSRFESVDAVVKASGFSHRHFAQLFKRHTGFHPKAFSRVKRFQKAVKLMKNTRIPFSEIAFIAGYSDQAHFTRDFMELAGVTPSLYRVIVPVNANHVMVERRGKSVVRP